MAFASRVWSLGRTTISPNVVSKGHAPGMFMLNAVRAMSSKLFIGGLSYGVDDQSLRDAFSNFGDVTEARVITDRDSGRSRGFAFVSFSNDESAAEAMSGMDGKELQGRNIRVSYATERAPRTGGYGGGGGNYGGDSSFGSAYGNE